MNALSVGPMLRTGAGQRMRNFIGESDLRLRSGRAAAQWRSIPSAKTITSGRPTARRAKSASRVRVRSESDSGLEKLLLLLLVIAAVIGVAYGFSCLVDLVQNWAVFERGTSNLI